MSLLYLSCGFSGAAVEKTFLLPQCSSLRNSNSSAVAVLYGRPHPCRDAEPDPHGLVDHGDSAVAGGHGDRCPCCAGAASSTTAVLEKSVVLPQLHLVRNSLRAAHELRGGRCRARGRVHRHTAPMIRCISCVVMDEHASLHTGPHHNHHNHHNTQHTTHNSWVWWRPSSLSPRTGFNRIFGLFSVFFSFSWTRW